MHRGVNARACRDGHRAHHGRSVCQGCTARARYARDQGAYRQTWRRDDLLDRWARRGPRVTFHDFPRRVGISYAAWERAYRRAQQAGDPRATGRTP
jgi:hypothetical protein